MSKRMKRTGLRNNKLIFGLILILLLAVFFGTLLFLRNVFQTETYYVLNQDVSTRTQIKPEMLEPITTSLGTAPKAALNVSDIQKGYTYSKYPLLAGDILTYSNTGGFEDISVGIPDTWVVTSFGIKADDAVGGRVKRGVYFDVLIATNNTAFYPFVNVLCLDTTVSLNNASSNAAADTKEAHEGQTTQYVVGMPPADAAKLHQLIKQYGNNMKLILSPRQNEYKAPSLASYSGVFKYENDTKNMGKGTDYTFTPAERDSFGRPINVQENCSEGNAKLTDEACGNTSSSSDTPEQKEEATSTPSPTKNNSTPTPTKKN